MKTGIIGVDIQQQKLILSRSAVPESGMRAESRCLQRICIVDSSKQWPEDRGSRGITARDKGDLGDEAVSCPFPMSSKRGDEPRNKVTLS